MRQTKIRIYILACVLVSGGRVHGEELINLARLPGAIAIGSGSHGPFVISKLTDGRTETMQMWSSNSGDGAFGGVALGPDPVAVNAVRYYLFNERSTFTGWRLEGSDDVEIDEDPDPGVAPGFAEVYDPFLIIADLERPFVSRKNVPEPSVVTISFCPVETQSVRLVFPHLPGGARATVAVPELEVYHDRSDRTSRAALNAGPGVALDQRQRTLTMAQPALVSELRNALLVPAGVTVFVHDGAGRLLAEDELVYQGSVVVTRFESGGGDQPTELEYVGYAVRDRSAPPLPPRPPKAVRAPKPPKPPVSIPSAPAAPAGTPNLIVGATITGSIRPESAESFVKTGMGNWFLTQQLPQWIQVDFGEETEFNYVSVGGDQIVHFVVQTSNDAMIWQQRLEVERIRPSYAWNGFFETPSARYLRLVLLTPSWDVHVRKLMVARLSEPVAQ
jgi:hypothetical protein